jgi:hypothetical protein
MNPFKVPWITADSLTDVCSVLVKGLDVVERR